MIATFALASTLAALAPTSTEVTVYNAGFALVKELRTLDLKEGVQTIDVRDVAARIEPNSVGMASLSTPNGLSILEQNYKYDLISPYAILNKSVGKRIRFIRAFGNSKETLEGTLLNAPTSIVASSDGGQQQTYNGMVIRADDGRIVLSPFGEIQVEAVPEGLISTPTLQWMLDSEKSGPNRIELSYLSQGMNWHADYVLLYDGKGSGDLKGWVTVDNQSGAKFVDAKLKLLAGDVYRAQTPQRVREVMYKAAAPAAIDAAGAFKEEQLFEYHLYTLQRPATLANNETKQLSLLEGQGVSVVKRLIIDSMEGYFGYYPNEGEVGTGDIKPQVRLEFKNSKENHLGIPLPKGTIKVYQRDASGSVQMLGEAAIDHTPRDEKLSLAVGQAFDIRASRKRTNYHRVSGNTFEESFEIELRNRKDTAETVDVLERHWGDWRILSASDNWDKADSNTMLFKIALAPQQVKKVTYTVRTSW